MYGKRRPDKELEMAKGPGKEPPGGNQPDGAGRPLPHGRRGARAWFESILWPAGEVVCLKCGSTDAYRVKSGKPQPYRCRDCRSYFSLKTNTALAGSNLTLRQWAFGIYLVVTNLKSVSSMKLHRDLRVTQKTAWFMLHRIRETWGGGTPASFHGPVEVDESYFGGKRASMSNAKRKELEGTGRGPAGKTAVVAAKDRASNRVAARVVTEVDGGTLNSFVDEHTSPDAEVYTDGSSAYQGRENHEAVAHSAGEYVKYLDGVAVHTNGVESFWSMLKRAHKGTFHRLSAKHLQRYVSEFVGRHNMRELGHHRPDGGRGSRTDRAPVALSGPDRSDGTSRRWRPDPWIATACTVPTARLLLSS